VLWTCERRIFCLHRPENLAIFSPKSARTENGPRPPPTTIVESDRLPAGPLDCRDAKFLLAPPTNCHRPPRKPLMKRRPTVCIFFNPAAALWSRLSSGACSHRCCTSPTATLRTLRTSPDRCRSIYKRLRPTPPATASSGANCRLRCLIRSPMTHLASSTGGQAAGQIYFTGNTLFEGSTPIGDIFGGRGGEPLRITFGEEFTPPAPEQDRR